MRINEVVSIDRTSLNEDGLIQNVYDLIRYWNLATPAYKAWHNIRDIKTLSNQGDSRYDTPEKTQYAIEQELAAFATATASMLASSAIIKRVVPMLPRIIPFFGSHPIVRLLTALLSSGMQLYVMHWVNSEEGRNLIARWLTGQTLLGGGEKATEYVGGALDAGFTKLGELLPDSVRSTLGLEPQGGQGAKPQEPGTSIAKPEEVPGKVDLLKGDPGEYAGPGFVRSQSGQIMPKTGIASIDYPTRG